MPDPGSFDKGDYVGLPASEAGRLAEDRGWRPRRLPPHSVITLEYRYGRLNLFVDEDDRVVDASIG